jgi:hypothetical protein
MAVVNPNAFAMRFVMHKAVAHISNYRYKLCTLLDKLRMTKILREIEKKQAILQFFFAFSVFFCG